MKIVDGFLSSRDTSFEAANCGRLGIDIRRPLRIQTRLRDHVYLMKEYLQTSKNIYKQVTMLKSGGFDEDSYFRHKLRHAYYTTRNTREHWIQRITFTAENNAACSRGSVDTHTHTHCMMPSDTIPSLPSERRRR